MAPPTGSSHNDLGLAALVAAGGVTGFLKTRSTPSLVAGLAFGSTFGASAYLINNGRSDLGHPLSLVSSMALLGAMLPRFIKTRKIWPAGIVSLAAAANAPYQAMKTREWLDL